MNIKIICFLFFTGIVLSASLALALDEVAKFEGSLNVGRDEGLINIGPVNGSSNPFCGNSLIESGEQCDSSNLNNQTCASLLGVNYTGTLLCKAGCIFDTSKCSLVSDNNGNNNGNNHVSGGGGGGSSIIINKNKTSDSAKGCVEDWSCSDWDVCIGGKQVRTCSDKNKCSTTFLKPALERICEENGIFDEKSNSIGALLGAVIGTGPNAIINIGLIVFFFLALIAIAVILSVSRRKKGEVVVKVNNINNSGVKSGS